MLVAVLTPVYNGAKFLEGAMRAVQAQTYRPLVHVVLDNASTDGTAEIIDRFVAEAGPVPILRHRNAEVLPAARNWSAAVRAVPSEAVYFKILCADDSMTPDAIARMAKVAQSADDVRAVFGVDNINGVPIWHAMPSETQVFEAGNLLARIFADGSDLPYHHAMYRTDTRGETDFFPSGVVAFDAEAAMRALIKGGRAGVVTEAIFDTLDHAESLTSTWTKKEAAQHWEHYQRLRTYGPVSMTSEEFARVKRRIELRLYRKLLWRLVSGKGEAARRDLERLKEAGASPGLSGWLAAIADYPAFYWRYKLNARRPHRAWPSEAVRLERSSA